VKSEIGTTIVGIGIGLICTSGVMMLLQATPKERADEITKSFKPFSPKVTTRSDDKNFYVESDGMPDHEMMVGIVAWQQQVPLPQPYKGANAWRFPLFPKPAEKSLSAKTGFFRGAIAIAANGVPIFNPIKNDGKTDTFLAGELDKFGGHGGRGDDYHYHTAPLHLIPTVGKTIPIAYALDGYGIYGLECKDGKAPADLDTFNGHTTKDWGYHYHATKTYPYLNGGFHGEVTEAGGQVDPQPRSRPVREALPPLRGAKVTGFKKNSENSYTLNYTLNGETYTINYSIEKDGKYNFTFIDPSGKERKETYSGQARGGGGGGRGGGRGPGGPPQESGGKVSDPTGSPGKPWIFQHAAELDTDKDTIVTLIEINGLIKSAFAEVAGSKESISLEDLKKARPPKNVIGGYLKGHADEFDANGDRNVTLQEVLDEFSSLFHKGDKNHDHALTKEEYDT